MIPTRYGWFPCESVEDPCLESVHYVKNVYSKLETLVIIHHVWLLSNRQVMVVGVE